MPPMRPSSQARSAAANCPTVLLGRYRELVFWCCGAIRDRLQHGEGCRVGLLLERHASCVKGTVTSVTGIFEPSRRPRAARSDQVSQGHLLRGLRTVERFWMPSKVLSTFASWAAG